MTDMDLIKLIMEQLSPQLIGRIAGASGLDRASTEKAIGAAVPAILSALVGLVSKSDGANRLATMLQQQSPDQLERAASMIGSGNQQALIDQGTGSLASLLGDDALGSLTGALGRFAGTGEGQAKSLLGMAAPLVMGVLGRQQSHAGLDAGGLADLLISQKDSIVRALPSGLASLLSGTGLLEGVADRLRGVGTAASRATEGAAGSPQGGAPAPAARASAAGGSPMRWAWIAAAIVVVAALAYQFVGGKPDQEMAEQTTPSATPATQQAPEATLQATEEATGATSQATQQASEATSQATEEATDAASQGAQQATEPASQATEEAIGAATQGAQQATEATSQATQSVAALTVGDVDLGKHLTAVFDDAKKALQEVNDAASAEAARPKLQEIADNLDEIGNLAGQLPADGKQALTGMVDGATPEIHELIDKVMAMPGVADVLKTTLEPIKTKLQALSTA
jgi:hypothetical protein